MTNKDMIVERIDTKMKNLKGRFVSKKDDVNPYFVLLNELNIQRCA